MPHLTLTHLHYSYFHTPTTSQLELNCNLRFVEDIQTTLGSNIFPSVNILAQRIKTKQFSVCTVFSPYDKVFGTFVTIGLLKPHGLNTSVTNAVNIPLALQICFL